MLVQLRELICYNNLPSFLLPGISLSIRTLYCSFTKDSDKEYQQWQDAGGNWPVFSSPASLPRKQQMTQKKEMKTQDIEIPQPLGCRMDCLFYFMSKTFSILQGHEIPPCMRRWDVTKKKSTKTVPHPLQKTWTRSLKHWRDCGCVSKHPLQWGKNLKPFFIPLSGIVGQQWTDVGTAM